jgi:hypothetical protein
MQNAKFEVHRTIVYNAKVVEESEEVLLIKGMQKFTKGDFFFTCLQGVTKKCNKGA